MILVPLQTIIEPSAVRRQSLSEESDLGPGNKGRKHQSQLGTQGWRGCLGGTAEKKYTALERHLDQFLEQAMITARGEISWLEEKLHLLDC